MTAFSHNTLLPLLILLFFLVNPLFNSICPSVCPSFCRSITLELKSGKIRFSAPAHPSATGGLVSGLVQSNHVSSVKIVSPLNLCTKDPSQIYLHLPIFTSFPPHDFNTAVWADKNNVWVLFPATLMCLWR